MPGRSKILPVAYFVQPTSNTCQSTVLKMMAAYLDRFNLERGLQTVQLHIPDIYKTMNQDSARPDKVDQNSHQNMIWWLKQRFPKLKFQETVTHREDQAVEGIVQSIDRDSPVLVSVSHARVKGHFIMVIGYENYQLKTSRSDFRLVVHDPYGRFDPSLLSNLYGQQRFTNGMSLICGGETGPGKGVRLSIPNVSRQRAGDTARGTYFLISVSL